ncbi:MAG: ferritin-like domain-containing protein [Bacteroidota bacterium]|nr:ferritin-like domain-containing protein [Bacteroidota bacterium]
MGKHGVEILELDVQKLIRLLNEALCEEWLAYYQYWIGSRIMEGPMRSEIEPELLLHATQELNHATLVATRIIQLGGIPVTNPADWFKLAKCKYADPTDPYVEVVLNQNLEGERCAIQRYKELADFTNGKDHATHQMATTILNEELEHEQDIEEFLTDINRLKEDIRKFRL